jgi:hypothetical protein
LQLVGRQLAERLAKGDKDALILRAHCPMLATVAARSLGWCIAPAEREQFEGRFTDAWAQGRIGAGSVIAAWRKAV